MSSVQVTNGGDTNAQRRSQRVMLKVSVEVSTREPDDKTISEETRTVTVNAHGAMILLAAKVSVGQLLTLRNQRSGVCKASSWRDEGSRSRFYEALP